LPGILSPGAGIPNHELRAAAAAPPIARAIERLRLGLRPGGRLGRRGPPQMGETLPEASELAGPDEGEGDDEDGQGEGGGPEDPLGEAHVADVGGVHAQDAGDGAQGQEDDSDDGEGVDGGFLAVLVGLDAAEVLAAWLAGGWQRGPVGSARRLRFLPGHGSLPVPENAGCTHLLQI
jgi:hypothetical protein